MTSTRDNDATKAQSAPLPTQFAPAERALPDAVTAQAERFITSSHDLRTIIDAVPDVVVVLNRYRQIIFANRGTLTLLDRDNAEVLGLRPGEALNCIHAFEAAGGCGTTAFCSMCGAVRAILASQRGYADVQECRIAVRGSSDALDLRVWAVPYQSNGEKLTIFTVHNIQDEKRRRALERIFFHDVLNTAGAISFSTQLMPRVKPAEAEERAGGHRARGYSHARLPATRGQGRVLGPQLDRDAARCPASGLPTVFFYQGERSGSGHLQHEAIERTLSTGQGDF